MRSTLVYDLPTRIFHFFFATLFISSFAIAKIVDDESTVFTYHMLLGLMLGALVLWRLVWGIIGSKYAKFSQFNLNPKELKDYFFGILSGSKRRWQGHNPASSWAAITMFTLAAGLAITGYLMGTGHKESFEDVHEFMANMFVITAGLHIAGVMIHSMRHQDLIGLSMIDGKKELNDLHAPAIPSARPIAAVLLMALIVSSVLYINKNFDPQSRSLKVLGQTLQLGETHDD